MTKVIGLEVGRKVPDFTLPSDIGGTIHLYDLLGTRPLLIYFYPSDFGMMCAVVMKAFREIYEELSKHCTFLPISCNTMYSHGAWSDSLRLQFLLISDERCEVTKLYNVYGDDNDYLGDRSYRACFLTDKYGTLRYLWAPDDPSLEPDYDLLIRLSADLDREG